MKPVPHRLIRSSCLDGCVEKDNEAESEFSRRLAPLISDVCHRCGCGGDVCMSSLLYTVLL